MKTTHYTPAAIYVVLASAFTLGCEDSRIPPQLTGPATGTVEVVVATTGRTIDLDTDGYSVRLDAVSRGTIGVNGTVAFTDLATGEHVVQISGLTSNCSFLGPNERSLNVTGGGTTVAAFDIACALTFTQFEGDIAYVQGADSAAEIYVIKSGAEPIRLTIGSLPWGRHVIQLKGLASNCSVSETLARHIDISPDRAAPAISFVVKCSGEEDESGWWDY